ncbi:Trm112 family protein [Carnimonas nigrificans]|uniref:Trm112 family protein n=1 Tax=Carnimonas nigrificans TaxID=64323 RepID=UPI00047037EA|nr:Trm112 family protein [Carnimonas nigrificans]
MDKELLAMLVCPQSQAPLEYDKERSELVCRQSGLAYPIRDGIPVMLVNEARQLETEEKLGKPRVEAPAPGGE